MAGSDPELDSAGVLKRELTTLAVAVQDFTETPSSTWGRSKVVSTPPRGRESPGCLACAKR